MLVNKKFDYSLYNEDIFYKIIYPLFAKEFLFGNDYEQFAELILNRFILNSTQWICILAHWKQKEEILKIE